MEEGGSWQQFKLGKQVKIQPRFTPVLSFIRIVVSVTHTMGKTFLIVIMDRKQAMIHQFKNYKLYITEIFYHIGFFFRFRLE